MALAWLLYRRSVRPLQLAGMAISYAGVMPVLLRGTSPCKPARRLAVYRTWKRMQARWQAGLVTLPAGRQRMPATCRWGATSAVPMTPW